MNSSKTPVREARAQRVAVTGDSLVFDLIDGRSISAPLVWYPRVLHASPRERNNWRLIAGGEGIHWPDLDEDVCVESIILGRASGESQASLKRWLESREAGARKPRGATLKFTRQTPRAGRHAAREI
jgi:hypothetical protein